MYEGMACISLVQWLGFTNGMVNYLLYTRVMPDRDLSLFDFRNGKTNDLKSLLLLARDSLKKIGFACC